jgi:hypothetical protein
MNHTRQSVDAPARSPRREVEDNGPDLASEIAAIEHAALVAERDAKQCAARLLATFVANSAHLNSRGS